MIYKLFIYSDILKKYIYIYDKVEDKKTKKIGYINKISLKGQDDRKILKNIEYIEVIFTNFKKNYLLKNIDCLKIKN